MLGGKYSQYIMHFNISENVALRGETGHRMQRFYWKEAWVHSIPRSDSRISKKKLDALGLRQGVPRNEQRVPIKESGKEERYSFIYARLFLELSICWNAYI
jgi:hypothetical protein